MAPVILLLLCLVAPSFAQRSGCPPTEEIPLCPCYDVEEGVSLECPEVDLATLEAVVTRVRDVPIVSLSVYSPEGNVSVFPRGVFQRSAPVKALKLTQCQVSEFQPGAFKGLEKSLESLTIVNSELTDLPLDAVKPLAKLTSLVVESSRISGEIEGYSFHGLPLATLSLANNEISSVADDAFAGCEQTLTSIDLTGNRLTSIPAIAVKRLAGLETLKLKGNRIEIFNSLTEMPRLATLDLSANRLENLTGEAFRGARNLRTVSLYFNELSSLPKDVFSHLDRLGSVALGYNHISDLDVDVFKGKEELKHVDLSHNNLERLAVGIFRNLPSLEEVVLSHNELTGIGADFFKGSLPLTMLHLQNNEITKIHPKAFSSLINLAQLHLNNNKLKKLPGKVFESLEALRSLNLAENSLKTLESDTFSPLTSLVELRLQDNELASIPADTFSSLTRLVQLHLQNNKIESIAQGAFSRLSNLRLLNLDGNKLTKLGSILDPSGASMLTTLSVAGNDIEEIHQEAFIRQSRLKTLKLSDNRIQKIGLGVFSSLMGLKKLHLENNVIRKIDEDSFAKMTGLMVLDLSKNHLAELTSGTFRGLSSLSDLNLDSNEIANIQPKTFMPLGKLRTLSLKGNPLATLEPHFFKFGATGNSGLKKLDLESCRITRIPSEEVFSGLSKLEELNLGSNELTVVQGQFLKLPNLKSLKISRNPIRSAPELLSYLPALKNLEMDQVPLLSDLSRDFFPEESQLQRLSLSGNSLPSLTLEHLRSLQNLTQFVAENSSLVASNFFRSEAPLEGLEHVDLSGNEFLELRRSMLALLKNAAFLDLRRCGVTKIEPRAFDDSGKLRILVLASNKLDFLSPATFTGSPDLETLDLSGNLFSALPFAARKSSLRSLKSLNLAGNPLVNIRGPDEFHLSGSGAVISPEETVELMKTGIIELDMSRGKLTYVSTHDFEGFDQLATLNLRENAISEISEGAFESLGSLTTLDLSFNELTKLDSGRLRGLTSLRSLNLTRNYLETLSGFSVARGLKVLDASFNRISALNAETFEDLEGLESLVIRGNLINVVGSKAFAPLKSLSYLDLSDNKVAKLSPRVFRPIEDRLKILLLTGNPFTCDCSMESFYTWVSDHEAVLTRSKTDASKLIDESSSPSSTSSSAFGGFNSRTNRDRRSSTSDRQLPTCSSPTEFKGTPLTDTRLTQACSTPLISDLAVEGVEPTAILVSWDSPAFTSQAHVKGFRIFYRQISSNGPSSSEEVDGADVDSSTAGFRDLDPQSSSFKMENLTSDARYQICVVAVESASSSSSETFVQSDARMTSGRDRRCSEARTLPMHLGGVVMPSAESTLTTSIDEDAESGSTLWLWLAVAIGLALVAAILALVALLIVRRKNARRRSRTPYEHRRQGSGNGATAVMMADHHDHAKYQEGSLATPSVGYVGYPAYGSSVVGVNGDTMPSSTAIPMNGNGNGNAVDYSAYRHMTMRSDGAFESAYSSGAGGHHNNGNHHHNGGY